jgi:hypothetical protein
MDEILVNDRTSRFPPAIGGNGGSGFVVLWNDVAHAEIKARILLASGELSGDEFSVNTTTVGTHIFPAVAMLAGFQPGFAVAWISETPAGRDVLLQRFAPDGTKSGQETRVNTTDVNAEHRPTIARFGDLNFVVSWVSANLDEGIRAQIFTPDGSRLGTEFRVNTSTGVHFGPVISAPLQNNSFVIAWEGGPNFGSTSARLQIFEPTGSKIGPEKVPNWVGFTGEMAMTFLDNPQLSAEPGHFVIARTSSAGGGEEKLVIAELFNQDGDRQGGINLTHRDDHTIGFQPAVAALPNQRFVVGWTQLNVPAFGNPTGQNIRASFGSETLGSLTDPAMSVNTTPGGDQNRPCVAAIVGELGEVVAFAWVDDSVSGADSSFRAVKARVLSSGSFPP